jgi:hypothetical protein
MRNLVFGTLLGDGSICRNCSTKDGTIIYSLIIGHNINQLDYLRWKAYQLGLDNSRIHSYISGYGSTMFKFSYFNSSFLREVASICLRNGKRTITDEWLSELDDLSLAVWYQDDGSWGRDSGHTKNGDRYSRSITFSTEGFDEESVVKLKNWLINRGYCAKIRRSKNKYNVIHLNHSSTIKFWNTVAPYIMIKSKLDLNLRSGIRFCECGVAIEERDKICLKCLYSKFKSGFKFHRTRLIRRFGTSSFEKLKLKEIINKSVPIYWVDPSIVGSKLDLRF